VDEFILAHLLGWFGKALVMRDYVLSLMSSVLFEFEELSLQHLLPNFKECWWDHIILDVLGCNLIGIYIGMKTCEWFQMREYDWAGKRAKKKKGVTGRFANFAKIFVPYRYDMYKWEIFKSLRHFLASLALLLCFTIIDLNAFFLKYFLWIPPPHPINAFRLIIWFLVGNPATREFYQYCFDKECKRLGTQAWIGFAMLFTESLLSFKYSDDMFYKPFPSDVKVAWTITFTILALWAFYLAIRSDKKKIK